MLADIIFIIHILWVFWIAIPAPIVIYLALTNTDKLTKWFYVWVASIVGTQGIQLFLDGHCPLTILERFLRHSSDKIFFIDRLIGTQIPQSVTVGLLSICLVIGLYVIFKFKINGKEKNLKEKINKENTRNS